MAASAHLTVVDSPLQNQTTDIFPSRGSVSVPRYILRNSDGGYLVDSATSSLVFCTRPEDARIFYLRKYAENTANSYGLTVVALSFEPTPNAEVKLSKNPILSDLEMLVSMCISAAGAVYQGLMPAFRCEKTGKSCEALALFCSPRWKSTLALPLAGLNSDGVRAALRASDVKFSLAETATRRG